MQSQNDGLSMNNKTHTSAFNLVKSPSNPIFAAKTIVPSIVPLSGLRTPSPTNEAVGAVNVPNAGIIVSNCNRIQLITPPSGVAAATSNK